ncbi:MAG: hypothetical protein ACJA2W_002563, partial [Planctomycetota bacterium]
EERFTDGAPSLQRHPCQAASDHVAVSFLEPYRYG